MTSRRGFRRAARTRRIAPLALTALLAACAPERFEAPNVVVICIDTLRADHVGAYGYRRPTTPVIDAVAARGVLFEQVQSASNWTVPAVASIFTGRLPRSHGAVVPGALKHLGSVPKAPNEIAREVPVLAEILRDAGYRTALFSGNPYLYGRFQAGFDRAVVKSADADAHLPGILAWLGATRGERFLLYWQIMDLHQPIDPPAESANLFVRDPPPGFPEDIHRGWTFGNLREEEEPGFRRYAELKTGLYDGALRWVDDRISHLLSALDDLELTGDTLVVITSDHGEEFWDHFQEQAASGADPRGIWGIGHGHTMYQELLRVPMIVAGPGIAEDRRVRCPVSSVDLFPTILSVLGVPAVPNDGRDLSAFVGSGPPQCTERPLLSAAPAYGPESGAVRAGDLKLIWRDGAPPLLFDLAADPSERRNLAGHRPEDVRRLSGMLPKVTAGRRPAGEARTLDDALLEELRSLGYLE